MGNGDEKTIPDGRMRERYLFYYYAYCLHGRQPSRVVFTCLRTLATITYIMCGQDDDDVRAP
jgi:hypothetical protein